MATLAYEVQREHIPSLQTLEVKITGVAADTTATATFPKPFRSAPKVIGISRVDAVANDHYISQISTLSATGLVATFEAALAGSEVFYVYVRGELAGS
jgi:hypothetical protein